MSEWAMANSSFLRPQFRLRPGRDDAVIDWLTAMQPRQRSDAIRNALWNYLHAQTRPASERRTESTDLADALDALF